MLVEIIVRKDISRVTVTEPMAENKEVPLLYRLLCINYGVVYFVLSYTIEYFGVSVRRKIFLNLPLY